jgi:hypothetical protein
MTPFATIEEEKEGPNETIHYLGILRVFSVSNQVLVFN